MPAEEKKEENESEENTIAEIKDDEAKKEENKVDNSNTAVAISYNIDASELKKNKKLERTNSSIGYNLPKKAKLTNLTFSSFKDNITSGTVEKIFATLNVKIGNLRNIITEDAKKKAEDDAKKEFGVNEAMKNFAMNEGGNSNAPVDMKKTENILALKLEKTLSSATNPKKIIPLLEQSKIELTNSRKREYEFKEGKIPKAIMIPALLKKTVGTIGNNINRYTKNDENVNVVDLSVSSDVGEPQYEVEISSKKEEKKTAKKKQAKWEKVFGNLKENKEKSDETFKREEVNIPITMPLSSKITKNELRERRTLAEAGESLDEIQRIMGTVGYGAPFNDGLVQRRNELRKVIGDITGVSIPEVANIVVNKNTEFQNSLDRLLGVTEAPTREEHNKNQMKYDAYFNDPEFIKQIERQKLEGVLYDMNTPAFAASIDKAERIDNERKAMLSRQVNMEILDDNFENAVSAVENTRKPVVEQKTETVVTEVATEPKIEAVKTVVSEVKAKPTTEVVKKAETNRERIKTNFESDFKKYGLLSSKKIKRMHVTNVLPLEAKLYAKQLFDQNVRIDIQESAQVEAERLNTLNKLIDGAKEQASLLYNANVSKEKEDNMIKMSAKKEAQRLFELNKLIDGAKEQAQMLFDSGNKLKDEENNNIKASALIEASRLNELNKLLDSAKIQARMIYDADMHELIVTSAKEEAERLNEINKILDGAKEQAQELYNANKEFSANQAKIIEEARIKEMEEKKASIDRPIYEVTDARSRYAQVEDYSKPIKLVRERFNSFHKNAESRYAPSYKDTLISLRDELNDFAEQENLNNENHLKMVA